MDFAHVFWALSAVGAVLFFVGGFMTAAWRSARARAAPREEPPETMPPTLRPRATSFQGILEGLGGEASCAVLGDGLGLPIASTGDCPESLAGFCGFIAQAATRASAYLPLGHVRRIVLEDDRSGTLTACSLHGTDMFVATLTQGPGPDLPKMVQVLNDASSFLVERNRA
jgi:hypothetical protein